MKSRAVAVEPVDDLAGRRCAALEMRVAALEAQNEEDVRRLESFESALERLAAVTYLLVGRVTELEGRAGAASPPQERVTTIKGAAFETGFCQSQIRKLIAQKKIIARSQGGKVLIDASTLPPRRSAK